MYHTYFSENETWERIEESGPTGPDQLQNLGPGRTNFKILGPGCQIFVFVRAGPSGPGPTSDRKTGIQEGEGVVVN